eukprot:TRINITY_DN4378_c0_g1_i1.p1 TRINITY_DN4378_c0_g1~~TRINITY_DN4378_c0_g1_i1.p1  ORF type:complete len:127 (+),score=7.22 TRINITY_DN4378_c0_g1_i1:33-383(+)
METYTLIKLINFLRRKSQGKACPTCSAVFPSHSDLCTHIKDSNHFNLHTLSPEPWNAEQYLFPIDEDDPFLTNNLQLFSLCCDDRGSDVEPEAVIGVEAEDYSPPPEAQRLAAELQ